MAAVHCDQRQILKGGANTAVSCIRRGGNARAEDIKNQGVDAIAILGFWQAYVAASSDNLKAIGNDTACGHSEISQGKRLWVLLGDDTKNWNIAIRAIVEIGASIVECERKCAAGAGASGSWSCGGVEPSAILIEG